MTAEETILFSDLDGTLFNSEGAVSKTDREAIERYIAAGGRFALSTGRSPKNALRFIGDLPTNAPSVVFNGAGVYNFSTREYDFLTLLDKEWIFPLFRWAITEIPGLDLQIYTENEILYCTPEHTARQDFLDIHRPARFVSLDSLVGESVVKALLLPQQKEYDSRLGDRLKKTAPDHFDLKLGAVILGHARISYYEIMPLNATKGSALRKLRSHPVAAGRTFFAAGDYWNDYEMLMEVDVPVAPANAIDEIKALCKYVSVSNDKGAVAHIIDHIIPQHSRRVAQ